MGHEKDPTNHRSPLAGDCYGPVRGPLLHVHPQAPSPRLLPSGVDPAGKGGALMIALADLPACQQVLILALLFVAFVFVQLNTGPQGTSNKRTTR